MSLWRQITRGVRVLTNRTEADQDIDDEVQDFPSRMLGRPRDWIWAT
jgi:hypothetical protein